MATRTAKGNVTAEQRQKSGSGPNHSFPVFDHKSAMSAIKLRHNGKGMSASAVLAKVSRWANENNDESVKSAVAKAREVDKEK
jgi:hypothetical protein